MAGDERNPRDGFRVGAPRTLGLFFEPALVLAAMAFGRTLPLALDAETFFAIEQGCDPRSI